MLKLNIMMRYCLFLGIVIQFSFLSAEEQIVHIRLYELFDHRLPGYELVSEKEKNIEGFVKPQPVLEIRSLASLEEYLIKTFRSFPPEEKDVTVKPALSLTLKERDAEKLAVISSELVGKRLAIRIGEEFHSAPTINQVIDYGKISLVFGDTSERASIMNILKGLIKE